MFPLSPCFSFNLSLLPKHIWPPPKKLKKTQTFNFIIILNKTTDYREEFTLKALSFRDSRCRELKVQQPQLWSRWPLGTLKGPFFQTLGTVTWNPLGHGGWVKLSDARYLTAGQSQPALPSANHTLSAWPWAHLSPFPFLSDLISL